MALWSEYITPTNANIEIRSYGDKTTFDTENGNWTDREKKYENGWKNNYTMPVYFPKINGKKVNKSWVVVSENLTIITNNYYYKCPVHQK